MEQENKKWVCGEEMIMLPSDNVWFTGDIHGNIETLVWDIKERKRLRDCAVIVCGDIGLGFESPFHMYNKFHKLDDKLKKLGVTIYMFRGNHDDPDYFNQPYVETEGERTYRYYSMSERIKTVSDYTVIKTPHHGILCVGGAVSIDRTNRIKGITYWPDENVLEWPEDFFKILKDKHIDIDVVATHTAPSNTFPIDVDKHNQGRFIESWSVYDNSLKFDNYNERQILQNLGETLINEGHPLSYWIYGHFHQGFKMTDTLGDRDIKFIALDQCRTYKVQDKINNRKRSGCEWFRIGDKNFDKEYNTREYAIKVRDESTH